MPSHRNNVVNPHKIEKADIVVGIPSYNEADNISFVVKKADKGLARNFNNRKSVIINVDNNSSDGTKEAFLKTNIRQPIGGDFSFSSRLADYWLKQKWHKTTKKYGIDIFMTMNAIVGGFKIAQVGLGAKIHKPSSPKLGPMFSQVTTTLIKNIIAYRDKWLDLKTRKEVPFFGKKDLARPQTLGIDYKGMKATSIFNFRTNEDILRRGLSSKVFKKIEKMYEKESIKINDLLWCKIIYDIVYAYDKTDLNAGLIEALKPLYFGRFVNFFKSTLEKPFPACEQEIINQAEIFWLYRDYLIKKYKS